MNRESESETTKLDAPAESASRLGRSIAPFRKATLRGLAVVLPPLLTIVLFIWAWSVIESYVLRPIETISRYLIVSNIRVVHDDATVQRIVNRQPTRLTTENGRQVFVDDQGVKLTPVNKSWIPLYVVDLVDSQADEPPRSVQGYYDRYVQLRYLRRVLVIPAFLALFIGVLYILGKLLAAGIGRMLWRSFESLIDQLPIIRNVYSSVKQVTDFAFNETEFRYTRVVAVEYPRKGIWSMGFVTGESLLDIRTAADEPVLSVLMPTSPMPATGFTISVPKSQTVDLNISIDQAIQFCVSCGVVVPEHQQPRSTVDGEVRRRLGQADLLAGPATGAPPAGATTFGEPTSDDEGG